MNFLYSSFKFLYKLELGFTQSHSGPLGDFDDCIQLIPGSKKSDRPNNITGVDEILSTTDCIEGSKVNGRRQAILYTFALSSSSGHKIFREPRKKLLFKKVSISVLSHIDFYFEDDDHKPSISMGKRSVLRA